MKLDLLSQVHLLKIRKLEGRDQVWDSIRKKWVAFTPEEMVRQLFINYLINHQQISIGRIAIEKVIRLPKRTKRCDIIVYDIHQIPDIVIECKSPEVVLNEHVISQVVRYNQAIKATNLGVVNGIDYIIFKKGVDDKWQATIGDF